MKSAVLGVAGFLSAMAPSMAATDSSPIEHPMVVLRMGGGQSLVSDSEADVQISETETRELRADDGTVYGLSADIGTFRWVGALIAASYRQYGFHDPLSGGGRDLTNTMLSVGPCVRFIERPAIRLYGAAMVAVFEDWGGLQGFRLSGSSEHDVSLHLGADFAFGRRRRWGLNVEARWIGSTMEYAVGPNEDFPGAQTDLDIDPLELTVAGVIRFPGPGTGQ